MKKINENVIIASDKEMIDAGLINGNPREGEIDIWYYLYNGVWKKWEWAPIMRVFEEPLAEDMVDEDGYVIAKKSTHKIDSFYGAPINGRLDFRRSLESHNIHFEEL